MSDIAERLRAGARMFQYSGNEEEELAQAATEAADEIERLRAQLPDGMKDCTIVFKECERGHGTLTATNWVQHECQQCQIERLRALLETANAYGSGENAARIAAEEERDRLRAAIPIVEDGCVLVCIEDGELDRLRAEVAALNQPVKLSEWQELVAERDRLRELLREAAVYLPKLGWGKPGVDLPDRIDAALEEQKK